MIRVDVKRSLLYQEMLEEDSKKFFYCKGLQFVHNIDTFYYGVFIKDDSNDNYNLDRLFIELDKLKLQLKDRKQNLQPEYLGLQVKLGSYAMIYNYRLSNPDLFDIFISDYLPNEVTPRIVIQLRSFALWTIGIEKLLIQSYEYIYGLLDLFDLNISHTVENRIDYCYHTNSIQNPYKQFSGQNLEKHLHTTLTKYYKIGDIRKNKNINDFSLDYFALGQLKSNNVFNRNYNKVKEVIELGYKSFFFELWYKQGLISLYDKYCLEFAYIKKNYYAIAEGRLNFYLEFGNDVRHKKEIQLLLKDASTRHNDILELADKLTPKTTTVMNIEFQTKRKFYYYADKQIQMLNTYNNFEYKQLKRLFRIIDNRDLFLDYLTSETVSFRDKQKEYLDFWKRLRTTKTKTFSMSFLSEYKRDYSKTIDVKKQLKRTLNSLAVTSLYNNKTDTTFIEDFSQLLGVINDNDIQLALVDKDTGEIIEGLRKRELEIEYQDYKNKKYKTLKNRLPSHPCKDTDNSI